MKRRLIIKKRLARQRRICARNSLASKLNSALSIGERVLVHRASCSAIKDSVEGVNSVLAGHTRRARHHGLVTTFGNSKGLPRLKIGFTHEGDCETLAV